MKRKAEAPHCLGASLIRRTSPCHDAVTLPLRIATGVLLGTALFACSGPSPSSSPVDSKSEGPPDRVYHVQLQLTEDKDQAEVILSRGLQWWNRQPSSSRPPLVQEASSSDAAVSIKWKAPLYRVRIGPFATEQQAQTVLEQAHSVFPEAFLAPGRVDDQGSGDDGS